MPYNGSGNFDRVYSWITDAANGLPISSSRMDQDTNDIANGLTNCITRDGQSPALANIPLGGFKITGLAPGVASTDAATKGQVDLIDTTSWTNETAPVSFLSTTSFKILGADGTGFYFPGLRVQTVNTGGTFYGTVIGASYSAPDTTILLSMDSGTLDAGLSAVRKSTLTPNDTPVPFLTNLFVGGSVSTSLVSGVATVLTLPTPLNDRLSEISGNTFVPKTTGIYQLNGSIQITTSAATAGISGNDAFVAPYMTSVVQTGGVSYSWPFSNSLARSLSLSFCGTFTAAAAAVIDVRAVATFTGTAPTASVRGLSIRRVG